jgi:formylglycine-generating enzyme required for sulfatase activity
MVTTNFLQKVKPQKNKLLFISIGVLIVVGISFFLFLYYRDKHNIASVNLTLDSTEAKRRQQETADGLAVPIEKEINLGNNVTVTMVLIPSGEFMMGSPKNEKGRQDDERLHHVVIHKPFYIGKYEVTQHQYKAIMGNNPSNYKNDNHPVEQVMFGHAMDFVKKAGNGLRLPTEAEWEYACRAGSTKRFCFGDQEENLTEYAWWYGNSGARHTLPVGKKAPNAWGLYDMHGNVGEWCSSLYSPDYNGSETIVSEEPGDASVVHWSKERVLRGGTWVNSPKYCRSAFRKSVPAVGFRDIYGFRLAQDIE